MITLAAAVAAFLLLHLLVSGTRLRDTLTGAMGQNAYMGAFSVASLALLTWLIFAYGAARGGAEDGVFWTATPATRDLQIALQLFAFLLIVPGLTTPNPASVRQEGMLERPDVVRGMLRITRHPFLWGVALWAAGHLLVKGTTAAFLLFGSLLLLAILGTVSIDAKRRRTMGARWDSFAAATSNIPFAAIFSGRQALKVGEIGWWRLLLAVLVWAGLIWVHPYAFGAAVLPSQP